MQVGWIRVPMSHNEQTMLARYGGLASIFERLQVSLCKQYSSTFYGSTIGTSLDLVEASSCVAFSCGTSIPSVYASLIQYEGCS